MTTADGAYEITYTVEELVNQRWVGDGYRLSGMQAGLIRYEQLLRRRPHDSLRLIRITETRTVVAEHRPNPLGEAKP